MFVYKKELLVLVGVAGFEPATFTLLAWRYIVQKSLGTTFFYFSFTF